jgi:hypothetical protein
MLKRKDVSLIKSKRRLLFLFGCRDGNLGSCSSILIFRFSSLFSWPTSARLYSEAAYCSTNRLNNRKWRTSRATADRYGTRAINDT